MKKILCFLGFHKWIYQSEDKRTCKKCGIKQVYHNEGPVSGMADWEYWETLKN